MHGTLVAMEFFFGAVTATIVFLLMQGGVFKRERVLGKRTHGNDNEEALLFAHAPFAACLTSVSGSIMWGNEAFWKLCGSREVKNLGDLGSYFGVSLYPVRRTSKLHKGLSLPSGRADQSRQFTALRWPVQGNRRGRGELLTFHEQTNRDITHYQQVAFEHQIVQYLAMVGAELRHVSNRNSNVSHERVEALVQEVESLSNLILETHELTRRNPGHGVADLKKIILTAVSQHREAFESRGTHLIKTFPHTAPVHGSDVEFLVLLQVLLSAITAMLPKHKSVRMEIKQDAKKVHLTISIPEHQLHPNLVRKPFSFATAERGIPTPYRFWRLQLAIAHQIAAKHHGNLRVTSNSFEGTVYHLTLASKDTEA